MTTFRSGLGLLALVTGLALLSACAPAVPAPPASRVETVTDDLHGTAISDDYRWLEDGQAPDTRAWIDTQNLYTDKLIGERPGREALLTRLEALYKTDSRGVPSMAGDRLLFGGRKADQDKSRILVQEADGSERVLIEPAQVSDDATAAVGKMAISPSGALLAYSIRTGGKDEIRVRFRNVATGDDLDFELPEATYFGVDFIGEDEIVYSRFDLKNGSKVYRQKLDGGEPRLIFGEGYGPDYLVGVSAPDDGRYLLLHATRGSSGSVVEVWLQELGRDKAPRLITAEQPGRYGVSLANGTLFIKTNVDAPRGKVYVAKPRRSERKHWKEIIPEHETAVLQGVTLAGGRVFANYLEDVKSRVMVFDPSGKALGEIEFPTVGRVGGVHGQWDKSVAFFSFTSYHTPSTVLRYDIESGEQELWFRPEIPVDTDAISVEQVFFESKDGTKVPMFIVKRKDLPAGPAPTILYGYGGFRVSLQPYFSALGASWVDMGGVYVVANLRGGGEYGEAWHADGMLDKKQNTFDDFHAAAEWLQKEGITSPDKLAIYGGSNGGLLVGAAMTQRPELYQAVVCAYPLLDMVRFHKFLKGPFWVAEYGSADEAEQFPFIHAYSPYHHVAAGTDYPATLLITGDGDTRVDPLHARKMTALLQAKSALARPVMLRYHTTQGHAGGVPVSQQIEDAADLIGFLSWQLGM